MTDNEQFLGFQRFPSQNRNASSMPFPVYGVTLEFFKHFINNVCGGENNILDKTTKDICEEFVKPMTVDTQRSLCELLVRQEDIHVGVADIFISHAWSCKFLDIYDALLNHFCEKSEVPIESTYVWFDLFSNNQHACVDRDFDWWCNTFKGAIGAMKHVVMVLAPWHDPVPLTRAWCLFELYCSAETKCKFEVAMSRKEHEMFVQSMVKDVEGCLLSVLNTIRCERSQAFDINDQKQIFQAVERTVGFAQINAMVFHQLRQWFVEALEASLVSKSSSSSLSLSPSPMTRSISLYESLMTHHYQHTSSSSSASNPLSPTLQRALTINSLSSLTLSSRHTSITVKDGVAGSSAHTDSFTNPENDALPPLSTPLTQREVSEEWHTRFGSEDYGDDESYWARLSALAQIFVLQGASEKAQVLLQPLYQRLLQRLGSDHPQTLAVGRDLAMAKQKHGHYSDAHRQYLLDYEQRRRLHGANHPDTLIAMNFVANNANHLGQYAEAETLHRSCLTTRLQVLGDEHPDTFWSQNNLALSLRDRAMFRLHQVQYQVACVDDKDASYKQCVDWIEEAICLLRTCHAGRERVLGPEHTLTLGALHNLANNLRDLASVYLTQWATDKTKPTAVDTEEASVSPQRDETQQRIVSLLDEAEQLYDTCFSKWVMTLGERHSLPLLARMNRSVSRILRQKWTALCRVEDTQRPQPGHRAEVLAIVAEQRLVVADMQQCLGDNHPFALQGIQFLATSLLYISTVDEDNDNDKESCDKEEKEHTEEMMTLFDFCLRERRHLLGVDHPATVMVQTIIADFESKNAAKVTQEGVNRISS